MSSHLVHLLAALAVSFLSALLMGRLAARLHVPRVTGYLLGGLLTGPAVAKKLGVPALLDHGDLDELRLLSDIALALILLTIGAQFRMEHLRRWGRRIAVLASCEILLTFFLVALLSTVLNLEVVRYTLNPEMGLGASSVYLGLFLGTIAAATAPAATLLVIREYESQGPLTDLVMTLVGINNLVSVLGFTCMAHFLLVPEGSLPPLTEQVFLPLLIGGFIGLGLSLWGQRLEINTERQLLLLGGVTAVVGLCQALELSFLMGCFACGMALVNTSPRERQLLEALRQIDYPLYVLFFVLAGANLHLETLGHIGLLGVSYVGGRTGGKLLGCWLGARLGRFSLVEEKWLGPAMLAQAGVAIGLASTLRGLWPEGGQLVETIVLSSVVLFELFGPVAVRLSLIQAGEVPLLTLLAKRAPEGSFESLHHIVDHFRLSLGLPSGHTLNSAADILVKHVMRTHVDAIRDDTPFQEVLRLIAHSRYDRFPVIDARGRFRGIIDYSEIRDVLFDPILAQVVVAGDLAKSAPLRVRPDQTLGEALALFNEHRNATYIPVIDEKEPDRLLGMVSQNDILAAFRRLNPKG